MARGRREVFVTVRSEGALLPPDFLRLIVEGRDRIPGLTPDAYHLPGNERLNEATSRSWNRLLGAWGAFQAGSQDLRASDPGTTVTREKWLLPLFQELGYGRLLGTKAIEVKEKTYPISHAWQHTPIHLVGRNVDLDQRTPGVAGAARVSPHGLVQELLNRSAEHLWGFLSNGLRLRMLRNSKSLTRQAYVEFDLAEMMEGQVYADFALLWLLCHQSRVEAERPQDCWLEKWAERARQEGTRALDHLRQGVEQAIEAFGRGFLAHAGNRELYEKLRSGALDMQDYYRQLLRIVYRLIFLFVAEDRDLLLTAKRGSPERDRYIKYYSVDRLRTLAERRRGSPHADLWRAFRLVVEKLSSETGCPELGLPPLGSYLWSGSATPDLDACELANQHLLDAVRALAFIVDGGIRRPVDFQSMGPEELGSVYESLLELHPKLNGDAASFALTTAAGHERKTTGSYYTPTSLVDCLLDTALGPILEDAAKKPDAAQAILQLKVCDPACGSGHFLIAAARRMANRLATVRTGDEEPSPQAVRTALRDVTGHCLYGVDINPMSAELCRVNLWLEALEPGKPLSFLDHHIRVGNSLMGTTLELVAAGLPDEAFVTIEGDDKTVCSALKKRNRQERDEFQQDMLYLMVAEPEAEYNTIAGLTCDIDNAPDDTIDEVQQKAEEFCKLVGSPGYQHAQQVADAWCAAFVWKKEANAPFEAITTDIIRRLEADPNALTPLQHREVGRLSSQYQFFHWHLAFPEVFAKGGFDCVLGNPPWDTLSPDRREYFGQFRVGMRSLSPDEQDGVIDELLQDPTLAAEWERHQRELFGLVHFLKNSGRFTLYAPGNLGKGDFNVYRMFTELALKQAREGGYAAQVLPGGIYGGANASAIRQFMMDHCELKHLWGLSNSKRGWFAQVDISRFAAFAARRGGRTGTFLAHFGLMEPADLAAEPVEIDADFLRQNAPDTYAIPDVRSAADLTVAAKMVGRYPNFGDLAAGPPVRHYQAELHMGNDRDRFTTDPAGLAVYEGRMIAHFDHRAKTYASGHGNSSVWIERPFGDPGKAIVPQWRVLPADIPGKLGDRCGRYRLGFRDVAQPRDVRSFIAAMIPPGVICGHKVPTIIFEQKYQWSYLPWLAVANSFLMDWMVRSKLSSPSMTYSLVDSLPFPRPKLDEPWVQRVAPLVLRLVCTAPEMTSYWNAMARHGFCVAVPDGTIPPNALATETAREMARAELDAIVAHDVFGLTRRELSDVLETFPVVKSRDEKTHGEYRTKLLILDVYDRMQAAIDSAGRPYETILDPPPADPRCCHPARK